MRGTPGVLLVLVCVVCASHGPRNIIIVEEAPEECFRRLFSGRRLSERHIRRSLPVPSAVECEMACTREQQFVCEGFNFRGDRQRLGRSSCELSALPMAELGPSLLRDFIEDREYDFFERRRGGPPECQPQGPSRPPPDYRPSPSHPAGVGGPPGNWHNAPPKHYGQQGPPRSPPGYGPQSFGPPRPPQSYGPQQGPPRPPQSFGPPHGPTPGYGPNQGPSQRPPQHYGGPQSSGPPPPQHQQPPHHGPQYGSQHQDRSPVGAPWSPGSVGFYGPPSSTGPRPGGFEQHNSGFDQHRSGFGGPHGGDFRPGPPGIEPASHKDDDECFARVWSGQRLDDSVIRASASQPSLGGCQLECLHAREFTCRAFSYRHGRSSHGGDSCLLTDTPMSDLHPRVGLVMDPEFEVYERSSFGNGCEHIPGFPSSTPWGQASFGEENNALPPLLAQPQQPPHRHGGGPGQNIGGHQLGGGNHHSGGGNHHPGGPGGPGYPGGPGGPQHGGAGHREEEHECYAEYWPAAKLAATAVSVATNAMSLPECMDRCTRAGQQWQTPCRSLAFRGGVHGHNCLLSELAQRDLRPDLDYIHESAGESWRLMAWDWADPRCRTPPSAGPPRPNAPGPSHGPPRPGYGDNFAKPQGGYGGPPPGGNSIAHWEQEPQKGSPPGGGWNAGGGGEPSHYTVSGKPCARGHVCQMNPQAGFWSCPVDNSGNSWDYCCSPSHNCGYSEGMKMPWCYVGQMKEQWRPCSERYWPYTKDNQESHREGRLLPVAFLHRSDPPGHHFNSTFHSTSRLRSLRMVSPYSSSTLRTSPPTTLRAVTPTSSSNSSQDDYDSHLTPVSLSIVHSKI